MIQKANYTASLTQDGTTSDPVVQFESRTHGIGVTWTRVSQGNYLGTVSGIDVPVENIIMRPRQYNWDDQVLFKSSFTWDSGVNYINVQTCDMGNGDAPTDGLMLPAQPFYLEVDFYTE